MTLTKEKRKNYKTLLIGALVVAIGFFFGGFSNGFFVSEKSVKYVKGTLKSYAFNNMGREQYNYKIKINETNKNFQIVASLVDNFDIEGFQQLVKNNDSLELAFLETPIMFFLNKNDLIYIKSNNKVYLTKTYSFEKLKNESSFSQYISMISFLIAAVLFFVLRNDKTKTTAE